MWSFSQSGVERKLVTLNDEYDYIVVGGGNSGCVLARRLTDEGYSVLLIEKGDAGDGVLHRTPLPGFHHFSDGKHSIVFESERDKQLDRSMTLITGRGLGGTTRINGGQFTLGVPAEYNAWEKLGNTGWSYQDLKPYLNKSETWVGPIPREYHGSDGPLQVRSFDEFVYGCNKQMLEAAARLGFPSIDDMHSPLEPSFGFNKMQFTVGADGTRQSSFRAYLPTKLIQSRPTILHVCTNVIGEKLSLSSSEGGRMRVAAIHVRTVDGKATRAVSAKREVVLAAGALASPHILLLSGIGPDSQLRSMSIKTNVDLPGVGNHLQDHIFLPTTYNCPLYDSFWAAIIRPHVLIREIYRYSRKCSGWLLGTMVESEVFGISSLIAEDGTPLPHAKEREDRTNPENLPDFAVLSTGLGDPRGDGVDRSKGFYGLNCALLRTRSSGRVSLKSSDSMDTPKVETNYLTNPEDWSALRAALRVSLALTRSMRENGYWLKEVLVPDGSSDEQLDAYIRQNAGTMMHYSSSCRMAKRDDPIAPGVVDATLRVYGIDNLRVADASIIPDAPSTHPSAIVYAIAEKCADMMLKEAAEMK